MNKTMYHINQMLSNFSSSVYSSVSSAASAAAPSGKAFLDVDDSACGADGGRGGGEGPPPERGGMGEVAPLANRWSRAFNAIAL